MNGVGLEFNHLFGFGVLDAAEMVMLAMVWKTAPPRFHCEAGTIATPQYFLTNIRSVEINYLSTIAVIKMHLRPICFVVSCATFQIHTSFCAPRTSYQMCVSDYRLLKLTKLFFELFRCSNFSFNTLPIFKCFSDIPATGNLILELDTDACMGTRTEVNYLEHVQAVVTLNSSRRGDTTLYLVSPSGTQYVFLKFLKYRSLNFDDKTAEIRKR